MPSQGWKSFAQAHKVQPGDRLEFDLLTRTRLQATVVKRVQYRERSQALAAAGDPEVSGDAAAVRTSESTDAQQSALPYLVESTSSVYVVGA